MNPLDILQKYIELCNSSVFMLQDHLGDNSVVDWYGRTIRGKHKIQSFIKYDMCQQYQHKFNNATISGPIEVKPTHLATRKIVREESQAIPGKSSFDTPLYTHKTPSLPEVTRGKTFLPEDDDDDDLGLGVLQSDEQITPPQSIFKKLKTDQPEMVKDKPTDQTQPTAVVAVDDTGSYSHLMYVESTGVLGRLNKMKHRGVTTTNCSSEPLSSPSSPILEKETTLKIAYRVRLRDNSIYFGLIIYERISSNNNLRRNLFLDFNDIEEQERRDEVLKKRAEETPRKRKTPLKRLMFI